MKRILAILMALVMCFGLLAACGGDSGDTSTPAPTPESTAAPTPPPVVDDPPADSGWVLSGDNPFEVSIAIQTNQLAPAPGNRLEERMKNEIGVTFIYDITPGDQAQERAAIMAAGDTLPDIIAFGQQDDELTRSGTKLMMDDYLATGMYPRIYTHVEPVWGRLIWRGGGVPDGLYTLPNYNRWYTLADGVTTYYTNEPSGVQFAIQKDVLAWNGYPDVEGVTPYDVFEWVLAYYKEHPTIDGMPTIGYTIPPFGGGDSWMLHNPPLQVDGGGNDGDVRINPETGEASLYYFGESAYKWYKLLNEMWNEGLVDREFATHTYDQWMEKLSQGRVLAMHHQAWHWGDATRALRDAGKYERTMAPTAPVWEGSGPPSYLDISVMNTNQGWSVSVMAEEPERIFTLIDELLSEYWQIILQWGEEGIDYTVGPDGMFAQTDERRDGANDVLWLQNNRLLALLDQMPKIQGILPENGNPNDPGLSPAEWRKGLSDYDRNFLEAYGMENWAGFYFRTQGSSNPPYYPTWQAPLTDLAKEADELMEGWNREQLPKVIMAPEGQFEDEWQKYVDFFMTDEMQNIYIPAFEDNFTEFAQMRIREAGAR